MIDWMTLTIDASEIERKYHSVLKHQSESILHLDVDGAIKRESSLFARVSPDTEKHSSDLFGLSINFGSQLVICGSPARTSKTHNLFGSSHPLLCFEMMVNFVERCLDIKLPKSPKLWNCTRIDYNRMYELGGHTGVLQALNFLRHSESRGANVTCAGTTVYWDKNSTYLSLKAYDKFQDLKRTMRQKKTFLTAEELALCESLLRFEMKLGRHYMYRQEERTGRKWYDYTAKDLADIFNEKLNQIIGKEMNITNHKGLRQKFQESAIKLGFTPMMGSRAYSTFNMIKVEGLETVKREMKKSTFYLHKKIMRHAGLSNADITTGRILEFRRKSIIIDQPITSFNQLRELLAAGA